jgi:ABC-type multidrug transport system fused ATPase/permease subunit
MFFHFTWSAILQLTLCLILLVVNLGPSALAGFCFFIFASPMQTLVMHRLFNLRQRAMVWTDKRAKLLQELLGGMRVIKFFGWEVSTPSSVAVSGLILFQMPFIERISEYRKTEMKHIRSLLLIRAANNAIAFTLPVLAAIVSFIVYAAIGHALDPAVIFTALTLFQLLRIPLQFMRMFRISLSKAKIVEKCLQPWV